jgi:hypothetical protein
MLIAATGHSDAQNPHSSQNSSSIEAVPSSMSIACGGQTSTHFSQPVHASLSMSGIIAAFPSDTLRGWRYAAFSAAWRRL